MKVAREEERPTLELRVRRRKERRRERRWRAQSWACKGDTLAAVVVLHVTRCRVLHALCAAERAQSHNPLFREGVVHAIRK